MVIVRDRYVVLAPSQEVLDLAENKSYDQTVNILSKSAKAVGLITSRQLIKVKHDIYDCSGKHPDVVATMALCRVGVPFLRYDTKVYTVEKDLTISIQDSSVCKTPAYLGENVEFGRMVVISKRIMAGMTVGQLAELLLENANRVYKVKDISFLEDYEVLKSIRSPRNKSVRPYWLYRTVGGYYSGILFETRAEKLLADLYTQLYQKVQNSAGIQRMRVEIGRSFCVDYKAPKLVEGEFCILRADFDPDALAEFEPMDPFPKEPSPTEQIELLDKEAEQRKELQAIADKAGYYKEKLVLHRKSGVLDPDKMLQVFGKNLVYCGLLHGSTEDRVWRFVNDQLVCERCVDFCTRVRGHVTKNLADTARYFISPYEPDNLYLSEGVFSQLRPGMTKDEFLEVIKAVKVQDSENRAKEANQGWKAREREKQEQDLYRRSLLRLPGEETVPDELNELILSILGTYTGRCETNPELCEYYRVYFYLRASLGYARQKELVKAYSKNLSHCVRSMVSRLKCFQSAGIPMGFYKGEMVLKRDSMVMFTLSLKQLPGQSTQVDEGATQAQED